MSSDRIHASRASLTTIPHELQSQILLHLLPTDITIRFPLLTPRAPPPATPSPSEALAAWKEYMSFSTDPAKWHLQPPRPWPQEWHSGMLGCEVPAEQFHGRYGLTCPPHPNARSPIPEREDERRERRRREREAEGLLEDDDREWNWGRGDKVKSEDFNDWGEDVLLSRSVDGKGCCSAAVRVMRLNNDLYIMAQKLLYATNTFSFPDVETLVDFTHTVSPESRNLMKRIALNACGEALYFHGCTHEDYKFEHDIPGPGSELVDALRMFDNLDEVVLAGIGPGVKKEPQWVTAVDGGLSIALQPANWRYHVEIPERWEFECAEIVARLVGVAVDERDNRAKSKGAIISRRLFGGTVISKKPEGVEDILGALRLLGTRIVAPDADYVLDSDEMIVDVAAVMEAASKVRAEEVAENERMGSWRYCPISSDPFPSG